MKSNMLTHSAWSEARKFVRVKCVTKARFPVTFEIVANHLRIGGLVYRPGYGHMAIVGLGWEGDGFVVNVKPLAFPQAVA